MLPQSFDPDLLNRELDRMPRPFVEYVIRSRPDGDASVKAGFAVMRDEEFVVLRAPGSKDAVEKPLLAWLDELVISAKQGRIPVSWPRDYRQAYDLWKQGYEMPAQGHSLRHWPVVSPAALDNLLKMGIRTVEELAAANVEVLGRLGMGGLALKQSAENWLAESKKTGTSVAELTSMQIRYKELQERNAELEKANTELKAQNDVYEKQLKAK